MPLKIKTTKTTGTKRPRTTYRRPTVPAHLARQRALNEALVRFLSEGGTIAKVVKALPAAERKARTVKARKRIPQQLRKNLTRERQRADRMQEARDFAERAVERLENKLALAKKDYESLHARAVNLENEIANGAETLTLITVPRDNN